MQEDGGGVSAQDYGYNNLPMSNYNMKNWEIIPNSKRHNLSELSISEIWENKLADESSDYQQERYLINTIRETHRDVQN